MTAKNPYDLLSSKEVYRNPWIRVREDRVKNPDGSDGVFGVVDGKPGSTVLAVNALGEAHLIREFKYGIGRWSTEAVSGGIEPGETPLEAARRELREETGLTAAEWHELGTVDPFTAVVKCPNYLFLALGTEEGQNSPDSGELIECFRVPFSGALQMVIDGQITHSASCVVILKAHLSGLLDSYRIGQAVERIE